MKVLDGDFELYAQGFVWTGPGEGRYVTLTQNITPKGGRFYVELFYLEGSEAARKMLESGKFDLNSETLYDYEDTLKIPHLFKPTTTWHETLEEAQNQYRAMLDGRETS